MRITKGCGLGARVMFGALFFAVEITCQEQAAVLKPLGNQTVVLGEQAHFFCQLLGREEDLRLRINGGLHALPFITPDLVIGVQSSAPRMDGLSVSNISINITATRERNLTLIECYDATMNSAAFSGGTLTVRGGPEEPEVGYEVNRDEKEIVLSWPHPFTWEDYPITGYDIVCRETESEKIIHDMTLNDTDILNEPVVNHTVDLPPCVPDCYTLQCTVTAFNSLDGSPFTLNFSFPLLKTNLRCRILAVKQTKLQDNKIGTFICVELPVLCVFQRVRYRVVISHGGDPVLELSREFNYSSGYTSECIEEKVSGELEEGTEYSLLVFVDDGDSGNSSSPIQTFTFCRGNSGGSDGDHRKNDESCLLGITAGIAVVLSLLVVLPVGVVLGCCGMWCLIRERERRHHFSDKGSESREESHYDVPVPTQSAITVTHNQAYASGNQRL